MIYSVKAERWREDGCWEAFYALSKKANSSDYDLLFLLISIDLPS